MKSSLPVSSERRTLCSRLGQKEDRARGNAGAARNEPDRRGDRRRVILVDIVLLRAGALNSPAYGGQMRVLAHRHEPGYPSQGEARGPDPERNPGRHGASAPRRRRRWLRDGRGLGTHFGCLDVRRRRSGSIDIERDLRVDRAARIHIELCLGRREPFAPELEP